jgi:hypothetical protein
MVVEDTARETPAMVVPQGPFIVVAADEDDGAAPANRRLDQTAGTRPIARLESFGRPRPGDARVVEDRALWRRDGGF